MFIKKPGRLAIYRDMTSSNVSSQRKDRSFVLAPEGVLYDTDDSQVFFTLPALNLTGNSVLGYRTPIEFPRRIGNRIVSAQFKTPGVPSSGFELDAP
jgi:hypothetical protein